MEYKLKEYIKSDLSRLCEPTLYNFIKYYLCPHGTTFPYVVWLRLIKRIKESNILRLAIGPVSYLIFRHYEFKYGIHVNSNIYIGKGLEIVHGNGVYLNCKSIGNNFTVYQNVTLGNSGKGGIPIVGDNVTVYTGSVVVGEIVLNDGCTVGALSFVNKDVNKGDLVVGISAHPIR